jgi:hypothetical protein
MDQNTSFEIFLLVSKNDMQIKTDPRYSVDSRLPFVSIPYLLRPPIDVNDPRRDLAPTSICIYKYKYIYIYIYKSLVFAFKTCNNFPVYINIHIDVYIYIYNYFMETSYRCE